MRILKKSESTCFISNSITTKVTIEILIEVNPILIEKI